jgi:short-subunit dehydrogenase
MQHLAGSVAIVTGASRGIGVNIARALAERGVHLSLAARSLDELEQVRAGIEAMGVRAIAIRCDVTSAEDRAELIRRTEDELGPVDILVNNAGIERIGSFDRSPVSDFADTLAINLEAPIHLTHAVLPGMLDRQRGHVVNIASGAGKAGVPYGTSYSTSKFGLVGFTHALKAEYLHSPVGFSVVCPGFVTEVGMYHRWAEQGAKGPRIGGTCSPDKVAKVTVRCIERNTLEATVNTPPLRPLIVLGAIAPSLSPRILHWMGYAKTFAKVADIEADRRNSD